MICQTRGFPNGMVRDRTAEFPHSYRSLPVDDNGLLLRCCLVFAWHMVGRVSMDPCRGAAGAGGAVSSYLRLLGARIRLEGRSVSRRLGLSSLQASRGLSRFKWPKKM